MDQGQLDALYQQYLGRGVDPSGLASWGGADYNTVVQGILGSQEYQNRQQQSQPAPQQSGGDINSIYQQYLGRGVDPSGAATYAGWNPQDIINAVTSSPEYAQRQGSANGVSPVAGPQFANPSAPTTWDTDLIPYKSADGNTYYAPNWLRPEDYVSSGFAPPYTQQEVSGKINPDWYRPGAGGVTYASVRGPSDLSGGEFVIDTKTGQFAKDKNGNLIPVPRPNSPDAGWFNDWGVLAVPLLAAGGVAALEGMGALGGAESVAGGVFDTWGMPSETLAELGLEGTTSGLSGVGASGDVLAGMGIEDAVAASTLAQAGLTGSQIANLAKGGLSLAGLASKLLGGSSTSGLKTTTGANIPLANALKTMSPNTGSQFGSQSGLQSGSMFGLSKGNVNPFVFAKDVPTQTIAASKADPFAALNVAQTPITPYNPLAHLVG